MAPIPNVNGYQILRNPFAFSGVNSGDLTAFGQSLEQGSIPGTLGDAVLGAQFNTSTWSPTTTAATAFVQALLGAGLKQYAKNDQAAQMDAVRSVLPQLAVNPRQVGVPQGVDERAFNALRNTAIANVATQQAAQNLELEKMASQQAITQENALLAKPYLRRYMQGGQQIPVQAYGAITPAPVAIPAAPATPAAMAMPAAPAQPAQPLFTSAPYLGASSGRPALSLEPGEELTLAPQPAAPTMSLPQAVQTVTAGQPQSIEDKMLAKWSDRAANMVMQGMTPSSAEDLASKVGGAELDALDRQYKDIQDSLDAAKQTRELVNQYKVALSQAGNTGFGGQALQSLSGVLGMGLSDQAQKYAGGQMLESLQSKGIALTGRAFKGPMSNRDVQIMLSAYPSVGQSELANQEILNRWEFAAHLQDQYAQFMTEMHRRGMDVIDADLAWSGIAKANPYAIQQPDGSYAPNQAWRTGELVMPGTAPAARPTESREQFIQRRTQELMQGGK